MYNNNMYKNWSFMSNEDSGVPKITHDSHFMEF